MLSNIIQFCYSCLVCGQASPGIAACVCVWCSLDACPPKDAKLGCSRSRKQGSAAAPCARGNDSCLLQLCTHTACLPGAPLHQREASAAQTWGLSGSWCEQILQEGYWKHQCVAGFLEEVLWPFLKGASECFVVWRCPHFSLQLLL